MGFNAYKKIFLSSSTFFQTLLLVLGFIAYTLSNEWKSMTANDDDRPREANLCVLGAFFNLIRFAGHLNKRGYIPREYPTWPSAPEPTWRWNARNELELRIWERQGPL